MRPRIRPDAYLCLCVGTHEQVFFGPEFRLAAATLAAQTAWAREKKLLELRKW